MPPTYDYWVRCRGAGYAYYNMVQSATSMHHAIATIKSTGAHVCFITHAHHSDWFTRFPLESPPMPTLPPRQQPVIPMSNLTLPTIHLNGSGRKTLLEDYNNAYKALNEALEAFYKIEFNARDYYVQSDTAFYSARTQRDCELARFAQIKEYLEAHLISLGE